MAKTRPQEMIRLLLSDLDKNTEADTAMGLLVLRSRQDHRS